MDDDIEIEIDSSGRDFAHGNGKNLCAENKVSIFFRRFGLHNSLESEVIENEKELLTFWSVKNFLLSAEAI